MKKKITPSASASPATMRLTRTISIWSGEIVSAVAWVSSAIFPNAECEPVAKTSAFASPETSEVPASSVLRAVHRIGLVAWLGVARCRQRLAGDGRVVHPHAERLHQTAVRGKDVAGFEQDHVARHELGRGHLPHCARAHDLRRIWEQFLERRQRLLGAIRLPEREHAIDHDYADDREPERRHALPRLAPLGEERERRGDPQNHRKEVHELLGKREQQRLVRDFLHFICPKLHEPPLRLGVAQPRESALQAGQGVGDREVVNLHPGLSCIFARRRRKFGRGRFRRRRSEGRAKPFSRRNPPIEGCAPLFAFCLRYRVADGDAVAAAMIAANPAATTGSTAASDALKMLMSGAT